VLLVESEYLGRGITLTVKAAVPLLTYGVGTRVSKAARQLQKHFLESRPP